MAFLMAIGSLGCTPSTRYTALFMPVLFLPPPPPPRRPFCESLPRPPPLPPPPPPVLGERSLAVAARLRSSDVDLCRSPVRRPPPACRSELARCPEKLFFTSCRPPSILTAVAAAVAAVAVAASSCRPSSPFSEPSWRAPSPLTGASCRSSRSLLSDAVSHSSLAKSDEFCLMSGGLWGVLAGTAGGLAGGTPGVAGAAGAPRPRRPPRPALWGARSARPVPPRPAAPRLKRGGWALRSYRLSLLPTEVHIYCSAPLLDSERTPRHSRVCGDLTGSTCRS